MRGVFTKYIAFTMVLVLALSALVLLPVGAEDEERYFIFDRVEDASGGEYLPVSSQLTLPLAPSAVFTASDLAICSAQSNAFYVSLQNNSNATAIRVSYTYNVQGGTATETAEKEIVPHTSGQKVILPAPHVGETVEKISISFLSDTTLTGSVVLYAFFDISTYIGGAQDELALSRCHYSEEANELQIQGSLSYAATVRYEGETLALFALSEGEDIHLSGKTPLARTDVSFHFSFAIPISRNDELFKRYVVAAITSVGERVPLCTPTYPSLPLTDPVAEQGFKGYHSEDFSRVMDNVPDVGIVDVYLDRLFATQSNGILYAGEYDYYYFDQDYIAQVERRIQNLEGVGASIYLRLLVGNSRDNLSFADEAPAGVSNRLAVLRNEAAQRDLYAIIDFLTGRIREKNNISGLIFGRSAELISQYSYCDTASLAQYTAFYAATFNLVAGVARRNIPALRVLLPISDRVWSGSADALQESKDFFGELFLSSLLAALETQILEPQSFGLMLESSVLSDLITGIDASHIGIDRLPAFLNVLEQTAAQHSYLDRSVFFSWQPGGVSDAAKLHADYLLKYTMLSQNDQVLAFFLDFSLAEARGEYEASQSIDYLARYINTNRLTEASQLALAELGVSSLDQFYADAAKLMKRRVYRTDLTAQGYANTPNIKGSAALWSFSSADDTLGWYEGTASQSFFVSSANQTAHTLVAQFSDESGYGEIAYHFDAPVDISFAPLFVMPIAVTGKAGSRYEIQLRFIADSAVIYASAVVEEGESGQLYLDLSNTPTALSDLRAVRLMARPLDGESTAFELHFGGMTVQSTTLEDKELSERVSAIWQNQALDPGSEPTRDYAVPLLVTAIVVVVSIAVCAVLILEYKRKKNKKLIKKVEL